MTNPAFDPQQPMLSECVVSAEMIRAYATRVGDTETLESDCAVAPPTFVLSVHRGFLPEVSLPPDSFALYGGHDLSFHAPLRAGETYFVRAQVIDTYEKSGRSGKMLIVARQATVSDAAGAPIAEMVERQVVCRRSSSGMAAPNGEPHPASGRERLPRPGSTAPEPARAALGARDKAPRSLPEVGDVLGPEARLAPSAAQVAGFAEDSHVYEDLFVDRDFALSLGYRDVIVPGPMQSACLEQFLRKQLPGWRLESLSVTFRMAMITADLIKLSAVVTEVHTIGSRARLDCDLIIESSDGERTTTGQATLSHEQSVATNNER